MLIMDRHFRLLIAVIALFLPLSKTEESNLDTTLPLPYSRSTNHKDTRTEYIITNVEDNLDKIYLSIDIEIMYVLDKTNTNTVLTENLLVNFTAQKGENITSTIWHGDQTITKDGNDDVQCKNFTTKIDVKDVLSYTDVIILTTISTKILKTDISNTILSWTNDKPQVLQPSGYEEQTQYLTTTNKNLHIGAVFVNNSFETIFVNRTVNIGNLSELFGEECLWKDNLNKDNELYVEGSGMLEDYIDVAEKLASIPIDYNDDDSSGMSSELRVDENGYFSRKEESEKSVGNPQTNELYKNYAVIIENDILDEPIKNEKEDVVEVDLEDSFILFSGSGSGSDEDIAAERTGNLQELQKNIKNSKAPVLNELTKNTDLEENWHPSSVLELSKHSNIMEDGSGSGDFHEEYIEDVAGKETGDFYLQETVYNESKKSYVTEEDIKYYKKVVTSFVEQMQKEKKDKLVPSEKEIGSGYSKLDEDYGDDSLASGSGSGSGCGDDEDFHKEYHQDTKREDKRKTDKADLTEDFYLQELQEDIKHSNATYLDLTVFNESTKNQTVF